MALVRFQTLLAKTPPAMGWLWLSRTLSDIGDSVHMLAFNWLLVEKTGSALAVVTAATLWQGGQVLAGWPGGRLADRFAPVRVLQGAYGLHGLVIGAFAWGILVDALPMWTFYALTFTLGLIGTPVDPASRGLLKQLYPDPQSLKTGNSLFSSGTAVAQTIGPVIGGIVFSTLPLGWAFGVNAGSYMLAALGLTAVGMGSRRVVVADGAPQAPPKSWLEQAKLGRSILDILIPVAVFLWLVAPLLTGLLPYQVQREGGKVLDLGLLNSALWTGVGLGLGLGTWLLNRVTDHATWSLRLLAVLASLTGIFGLTHGWLAVAIFAGVGLTAGATYLLLNQILLERIDSQNIAGLTGLLGSVLGIGIALGSFPLGWAVQQGHFVLVLGLGAGISFLTTSSVLFLIGTKRWSLNH